ncbi:MAG: PSD1 domain-containing protein [Planctomycetales bacterium]|nr:PSD1 domain-containing protein [Planctomycetales bacterium]
MKVVRHFFNNLSRNAIRGWVDSMKYMATIGVILYACMSNPVWIVAQEQSAEIGDSRQAIQFARDVQPLLARSCSGCHGGVKQSAELSFVSSAWVTDSDSAVVVPGQPNDSLIYQRIASTDPDIQMPPPEEELPRLSSEGIETIRVWIEQGASWQDHWSRSPLNPIALPSEELHQGIREWAIQPLDYLVYEWLQQNGLKPSQAAEPQQWLRRVSFDLTGLPPTLEDASRFQTTLAKATTEQQRDAAFEAMVDHLLSSVHFGERWTAMWLDLARYADSKGFEKDPHRDMWPYRDWLIDAFNSDMPYDQFTVKQLAGDMLPDAQFDDLVATAFHRNTQTNTEGGTDDEEFRIAAAIDRLNTTWTIWQGTTMGCVQCHDHPYEPLKNSEFYSGLALFNNTEDVDLDDEFPTLKFVQSDAARQELVNAEHKLDENFAKLDILGHKIVDSSQWQSLPIDQLESTSGAIGVVDDQIRVLAGTVAVGSTYTLQSYVPSLTALRFTILPESDDPTKWPEQGSVLSFLRAEVLDSEGNTKSVDFSAVIPDYRAGPYDCRDVLQDKAAGFGGYPKLQEPRWMVATLTQPLVLEAGQRLQLSLKQNASVTGGLSNHLRRFRVEYSDARELVTFNEDEEFLLLQQSINEAEKTIATQQGTPLPIMRERQTAAQRVTRRFVRGNWLERSDSVQPGIPEIFRHASAESDTAIHDRLDFARWLVSAENPVAARVWTNRIWAELFGTGIVETLEDFGPSGQPPSAPKLLDYLAYSMQHDYRWSLKALLKTIVLSATYRQDSRASRELRERDPANRWLARGPRTRLTAEMIRDQALSAAGVLSEKIGGPSVMPPQPEGVWQQVYSGAKWEAATGEDRYRRGIYTYWKRTSPYPGFMMFDTPNRDTCSPRRIPSNTPLQALVTLNSEVFTELAHHLAKRSLMETKGETTEAISQMFQRVVGRTPHAADLRELAELYQQLEHSLSTQPKANATNNAEAQTSETEAISAGVPAPLAEVALAILNSDWALTK